MRREKSDALNALAGKEWMEVEREPGPRDPSLGLTLKKPIERCNPEG